jgi:hypothetical protein
MTKEEYLNSLTKEDILLGISRYLFEFQEDIPEDICPEDIWNTIIDLEILSVI